MIEPQEVSQETRFDDHERHLSRRTFLGRALTLTIGSSTVLPLLAACAGQGPQTNLTFWNLFSGSDGERMVEMENNFSRAFPNVNLNSITLAWGEPYYTKLAM